MVSLKGLGVIGSFASHAGAPAPLEALTAAMEDTRSFSTRQSPVAAGAGWPLSVMCVFL